MKNGSRRRIYCYGKGPQLRLMVETALGRGDRLVGYFSQGQDCLEKLSAKPCDILIVDLEGSEGEGLELLTQVRRMAPWVSTVAIVERAAVPTAVKAVKAGACECFEKPVAADRFAEAIEKQLVRVALLPRSHRALTQMEIQILQLILGGKTSQDIAAHLHRSKRTIDVHRKNIMRKLQACSLVDLIKRALGMGLIDDAGSERCAEPDGAAHPVDDETRSRS
jgi:two-component system, LuxR family, response regulator FixJ